MTILSNHAASRVRNRSMGVLHLIAASESCEVSDILALLIPPSQPGQTSSSHAPAAQTDGEGSPQAAPSVAQSQAKASTDGGATEQAHEIPADSVTGDVSRASLGAGTEAPNSPEMASEVVGGFPVAAAPHHAEQRGERKATRGANPGTSLASADVTAGETAPLRQTKRQQVIDCHEANPDWNSFQIAEHLGFGAAHVQVIAGQCGIKLPPAPRPEQPNMRDKVIAVVEANPGLTTRQIAEAAGCSLGTAARWAKEARENAPAVPELPPLSKPSERLRPLVENDVTDVLHRPRKAPSGRFYLRDKVTGHFVHQSLQPASHGDGPMMTMDRKWAWYDTLDRYRGAKKRWPQIAEMRKEAVSK